MTDHDEATRWLPRLGELLIAVLMVYSGVMHFEFARFVANIVPSWIPWRLFWAYFTGIALFASGVSIATRKQSRLAAILLGCMLLAFVLLIHAPSMARSITEKPQDVTVLWSFNGTGGVNNALKDMALVLSAFLLAAARAEENDSLVRRGFGLWTGLFAAVMVLFGIEHLFYTGYTPGIPSWSLVTFWIPWRLFWGYLTGVVFLYTGAMILARRQERPAAAVLGGMVLTAAVLTYAFRMAGHAGNLGELTNTLKDVAVAGGALVLTSALPSRRRVGEERARAGEAIAAVRSEA